MDTKVNSTPVNKANNQAENDDELLKPYVDNKSITISLAHNYSNYRRVNMKTMGLRKDVIGSSINSSKVLCSHSKELEKYFPALLGISSNNPNFVSRCRTWLNNIQFAVNNEDVQLNVSFRYDKKEDYLRISEAERKIEEEYNKVDRANFAALKEALKIKIKKLDELESTKYLYGVPDSIEEYYIYRHCLLYSEVAKDPAFINSDPTIRFYIKDEAKETEKRKKLVDARIKAMNNLAELYSSEKKFDSVYVAIIAYNRENIMEAINKSRTDKTDYVMNFANNQPDKFNMFVADKQVETKALIETLIARGELFRSEYNQQITDINGNHIGANMNDAVTYFNDPANQDIRTGFENKLKLL